MNLTKTHKIIISIIVLVILIIVYISFDKKSQDELEKYKNINEDQFSTTTETGIKINTDSKGYTIEQVPIEEGSGVPKPIPDLTRKIVFGANVSLTTEVKKMVEEKIGSLQAELLKKPEYYSGWIDMGIYQKMAGDYEGTIISWKYASRLAPSDYTSLGNLGNLYAYFLKDNAMAESYYKQAITKGPTQAYLYIQLAEIYLDIFKDIDKARAIIDQGLSKIPNDPSLLQFKSSLQ